MPNYQLTKIYYIPIGDDRYYGHSALRWLCQREGLHKTAFRKGNKSKIYERMRELGLDAKDIKCVWVEDFPCNNRHEAKLRERWWIEKHGSLNVYIPTRTTDERRDVIKEYNKTYMPEYREKNKKEIAQQVRKYYDNHKEDIIDYVKKWRKENPEKIKEYIKKSNNVKACCDICGLEMLRQSISRHKKSQHSTS